MSASADIGPSGLADSVRTRLFVALQYLLPQHFLSRVVRAITRVRTPLVREPLIRAFDDRFHPDMRDRKSTRLNSSHEWISYAVFCLKKKTIMTTNTEHETAETCSP